MLVLALSGCGVGVGFGTDTDVGVGVGIGAAVAPGVGVGVGVSAPVSKLKGDDQHAAQLRAMGEDMLGSKASDAATVLKAQGFQQTDPGIWLNTKTNDVIKTTIKDGVISTVTINK